MSSQSLYFYFLSNSNVKQQIDIYAVWLCNTKIMNSIRRNTIRAFTRFYSEGTQSTPPPATPSPPASKVVPDVPGLSNNVIQPAATPLGPGVDPKKTGAYKVPEYFQYDNMSFFEAEIEMSKFRCPQPSALKK